MKRHCAAMLFGNSVLLALGASFFFGLALVLTQFGLRHMRPGEGVLISIPLLATLAWLLAPAVIDFRDTSVDGLIVFLAVGLAYPSLVTMLTYESNRVMGPGVAGALGNVAPLFAVTGAAVLLGEWPTSVQTIGILAIIGGVAALSLRGGKVTGRSWPCWAVAMPLAAALIRGVAQPLTKIGLAHWPSAFAAALFGFTASAVVVVLIALVRHGGRPTGFSRPGILWFCCVGLSNGMAVLCLYAALAGGSVALVAPLTATYPLVTLALSAIALRSERISMLLVAGVTLTVAGVAMLLWK